MLQNGIKQYLEEFLRKDYDAMVLLKEVENPSSFGVAKFDERGNLVKLIEKPKVPPSKYALIGVYFFKPVVFDRGITVDVRDSGGDPKSSNG
jgi:glucose-1-phosphate thymidylyltransferase